MARWTPGRRRPRTRGGHPVLCRCTTSARASSPHTRGSSSTAAETFSDTDVVPAHAGVIRRRPMANTAANGRPRTRGGHPKSVIGVGVAAGSSPHTRGSSQVGVFVRDAVRVVPAHAGVIPPSCLRISARIGRPRTRGGHPAAGIGSASGTASSPHTRGSSPTRLSRRSGPPGRPRTRGGHPAAMQENLGGAASSPHTRGSSRFGRPCSASHSVVPAHAGVIPRGARRSRRSACRPRTRGGHPALASGKGTAFGSSPHTRGASVDGQ